MAITRIDFHSANDALSRCKIRANMFEKPLNISTRKIITSINESLKLEMLGMLNAACQEHFIKKLFHILIGTSLAKDKYTSGGSNLDQAQSIGCAILHARKI